MKIKHTLVFLTSLVLMTAVWMPSAFAQQHCNVLKHRIQNRRAQLRNVNRSIQYVDAQIRRLQARKQSLLQQRNRLQNSLNQDQQLFEQSCSVCVILRNRVNALKVELNKVLNNMEAVSNQIHQINDEVTNLNSRVFSVRSEYNRLNCSHLIAGQTPQSTIDRCRTLFSQWNRIQGRINVLAGTVRKLRRRYNRLLNRLNYIDSVLDNLYSKVQRQCSGRPVVTNVQTLMRSGSRYKGLSGMLNNITTGIRKVRRVRLKKVRQLKVRRRKRHILKVVPRR